MVDRFYLFVGIVSDCRRARGVDALIMVWEACLIMTSACQALVGGACDEREGRGAVGC